MSKYFIWVLPLLFWVLPVQAAPEDFFPMIGQDTLAAAISRLAQEGSSGEKSEIELPRETYRVDLEVEDPSQPSVYVVNRAPLRVEVENWNIEEDSFSASQVRIQYPQIQVFMGSEKSLETYFQSKPHLMLPAAGELDLTQRYVTQPGQFDPLALIQNPESQVRIEHLELVRGAVSAIDTRTEPPRMAQLGEIDYSVSPLNTFEEPEPFKMDLGFKILSETPGSLVAELQSDTTAEENLNYHFKGAADNVDLAYIAPFIPLEEGWEIGGGAVGLSIDATCENNYYTASHLLKMDDVDVQVDDSESVAEEWVVNLLLQIAQSVYKHVELDFKVKGNLNDPKFDLEEEYNEALEDCVVRWTTLQTLRKLGLENNEFLQKQLGLKEKEAKEKK